LSIDQQFLKDLAAVFPDRPIEECYDIDDRDRFHTAKIPKGDRISSPPIMMNLSPVLSLLILKHLNPFIF